MLIKIKYPNTVTVIIWSAWTRWITNELENVCLKVDLGPKLRRITTVASQGSHNYDEWVTAYKLSYSLDGGKWTYYEEINEPKVRQYLYICFEKHSDLKY